MYIAWKEHIFSSEKFLTTKIRRKASSVSTQKLRGTKPFQHHKFTELTQKGFCLQAQWEGERHIYTHTDQHFCYWDASAFAGLQAAITMILPHYKSRLLLQGGILGQIPPALLSRQLFKAGRAGSEHTVPSRAAPSCTNTGDISSHAAAPAPRRARLEVTGHSPTRDAKRSWITAALAGQGRGTSSPVGPCQIRSAFQPTSLLAWAFSKDTHAAAWTLPARLCFGLQART